MNNKLRTAWAVAGIFAILFVIMTIMWGRETGFFGGDLATQRERVAEACRTADDLDTVACRNALEDLARLLSRFENRLERMGGDTSEMTATTSVEVGQ